MKNFKEETYMKNFKEETYDAIEGSGHKLEDVMLIGTYSGEYRMSMNEFDCYSDFEYDSGFGFEEIVPDLIIYFYDNSHIGRGEYDGSEWWEYNAPLVYKPEDDFKSFTELRNI